MKKAMMTTAGIVAAGVVAAAAGMVVGVKNGKTMRRVAENAAETVETTGRKFVRMVRKMK